MSAVTTLAAFILASASCTMWRTKDISTVRDVPDRSTRIESVLKASGEHINFAKSDPGRIHGFVIEGTALARLSVPIEIQGPFSSIKKRADGSVYEITDSDGRVHQVQRVLKEGDGRWSILINDMTTQPVSIPLSEVRQIHFKESRPLLAFIAIAVPTLGLLYLAIVSNLDH